MNIARSLAHAASGRRGFSLIEVLIAVVVLSLGLLGLAAVFPVVVTQQRRASDSVQGVSLERSAGEALLNDTRLTQPSYGPLVNPDNRFGWDMLIGDTAWSDREQWVLAEDTDASSPLEYAGGQLNFRAGTTLRYSMPAVQRVNPKTESAGGGTDPKYVWDFVARRVDAGFDLNDAGPSQAEQRAAMEDDNVQVALFVRRIDSGIRKGPNSLLALIRNAAVLPVAVSPATGAPTNDGRGDYSEIRRIDVRRVNGTQGRQISLDPAVALPQLRGLVAIPGQQLVDQIGVVHRVVGVVPSTVPNELIVRIEPPLSPKVDIFNQTHGGGEMHMLFTPQAPLGVRVITISRKTLS
ncbi:MAG: prepilin-type N-terminal cleavage/methylation domain-containing protein [Leptolyngbya sp. PLA1]|nr:prepilin-type N-terminal cleavage/methylation domain-containing protein [Leptolyngbya sp. PLA1]